METSQEKALQLSNTQLPKPKALRRSLEPELRKGFANFLRAGRSKDRDLSNPETSWLSQNRGLREYCYELNIPLKRLYLEIQQQLSEGKVRILDVGVGHGKFLQDLAFQFEDRIELEGLALTRQVPLSLKNYRQRLGSVENYPLPCFRYSFIFSVRGGLIYSIDQFAALQSLLNSLRTGGSAYLECPQFLLNQDWFQNCLKKVGFEIKILKRIKGLACAFCLRRQDDILVDLSGFSKTLFRLLNENKEFFLMQGFDRTHQSKILDPKFNSLYSPSHYIGIEPINIPGPSQSNTS